MSKAPGDSKNWKPEQVQRTAGGVTYSNLCYLDKTKTVFNFHRDIGRGFDPNYLMWRVNEPFRFRYGGRLLTGPEGIDDNRDRPYLRYVSNQRDRIHFVATDHHPRDLVSNSVYHGYIEAERAEYGLYRSDGTRLGDLSSTSTSPCKASDFTRVFAGDAISPVNNLRMTRGWPTDVELDTDGNPHVVFTARVDDNDEDHRFFYGRLTAAGWQVHELAKAGGHLYDRENDYTGLAALDPAAPNRLFISTPIDPRTGVALQHYEIFKGVSGDGGKTWMWSPITVNSSFDNLRPVVPRGSPGGYILVWMRGKYQSYTAYDTRIVGIVRLTATNTQYGTDAQ
jgi:hypothetical protein